MAPSFDRGQSAPRRGLCRRYAKCAALEWWETSNQEIEIPGSMNHPVNDNGIPSYDVEDEVGFHNQYAIAVFPEFWMSRNASQKWMLLKLADPLIKSVDERRSSGWAVLGDELQNGEKVLLRNRQIPKCGPSGHGLAGGASSSFADE